MFSALVSHKAEFVRLLLENGLCIIQFLEKEDTLCNLYKQIPSCVFLRKLANRAQGIKRISISHVSAEVRRLLGAFSQPVYQLPVHKIEIFSDDMDSPVSMNETPEAYISHYIPCNVRALADSEIQHLSF